MLATSFINSTNFNDFNLKTKRRDNDRYSRKKKFRNSLCG